MHRLGIRDLRANAATAIRRAEAGQETVITVSGRPVARLTPLTATGATGRTIDDLVAQGLLLAPRRSGVPNDVTVPVWGAVRLDRLLREVRG